MLPMPRDPKGRMRSWEARAILVVRGARGTGREADGLDDPVLAHYLRVPARAEFGRPALGGVVDVDDPEALAVALGPLEVVEERPEEIAPDVVALGEGPVEADEVLAEV